MALGEMSLSQIMRDLSLHAGRFGFSATGRGKREMLLQEMRTTREERGRWQGRESSKQDEPAPRAAAASSRVEQVPA